MQVTAMVEFLPYILLIPAAALGYVIGERRLRTRVTRAESELEFITKQQDELKEARDEAVAKREASELSKVRIEEENKALKAQMADWEKQKDEHLKATKASIAEVTNAASNKLLDDHKRETQKMREEAEKRMKETNKELMERFQNVFSSMDQLHQQVKEVDVIRQALLTPSGAGNLGEVTLENIFKASNLKVNIDFFLQYTIKTKSGQQLKPDAIVLLPSNEVLIVDSKASKFFVEIAQEKDDANKRQLRNKLKARMNEHLKALVVKDYKDALESNPGDLPIDGALGHVRMAMFLPSEIALENLREIDPEFLDRAWKQDILPLSPTGLTSLLMMTRFTIAEAQQRENIREISDEVRALVAAVSTLYGHADSMGKGLEGAMKKYNNFAKSFNRTFTSKIKRLSKLGVSAPQDKGAAALPVYDIADRAVYIDGESEEVNELQLTDDSDAA